MIELVGSPKQVAWATELKTNFMACVATNLRIAPAVTADQTAAITDVIARMVESETSAKWFIDNKSHAKLIANVWDGLFGETLGWDNNPFQYAL